VVRVEEERLLVEVRDAGVDRHRRDTTASDDDVLSRYPALRRLRPLLESMQALVDVEPSRISGCRFRVSLPRTRQCLVARVIRVGTHELALPASAIDSVHDFGAVQVNQDASGALVAVDGRSIPLVHLAVLCGDPSYDELVRQYVVVVGSFERRAALFASGPLRTVSGQTLPVSPADWLSQLQCDEDVFELLDPGALLGRRKSTKVRGAAVHDKVDRDAGEPTLFVDRMAPAAQPARSTCTVLVVNSSEVEGTTLSHSLKGASFRAITARTGTEALQILATEPIDLMVCDLRLPEMNAQQISEHRKRTGEHATVPLLLVLSHVGEQGHLVAQQLGAADFVSSPIAQDDFVMVVKRLTEVS
jgi:CheY-like chemotaxis protein